MEIQQLYEIYIKNPVITTDSRNIPDGSIFFALKGENFDGNVFAEQALKNGAAYSIIDDPKYESSSKTIFVENVLKSLQELSLYHRKQFNIPIIGITGTNGKTTTKELTNAVLSKKYKVVCTQGNLNNHIGVPLTLLKIQRDTELAIIEMGANHPGEIKFLCDLALPTHGLITNIGKAHLEGFGSFEGVIQTKKELYDFLIKTKGKIFANRDNIILSNLLESYEYVRYGKETGNMCRLKSHKANPFLEIEVLFLKRENQQEIFEETQLNSNLIGAYNAENILAAACLGYFFNVPVTDIQNAVTNYQPSNNRSQYLTTENNEIIMDAYNANPTSMKASLENFSGIKKNNKVLILGDMLELGEYSRSEHQNILSLIEKTGIELVFLVGDVFHEITKSKTIKSFVRVEEFINFTQHNPIKNSFILIKGSRGIRLEKVLDVL